MLHICNISQLHGQISYNYVSIYTSYQLNAINNVTKSTGIHKNSHYWHMPLSKYSCYIAHIYTTAILYSALLHTTIKNKYTVKFIYNTTATYVPATKIPVTCYKYLMCISGESMPIYMSYMNSLSSTMWPGALFTYDNENDADNTGWWQPWQCQWWSYSLVAYTELAIWPKLWKTKLKKKYLQRIWGKTKYTG